MTRSSPAQVAFSSGDISPLLRARFDYQRFQTGLAVCKGFVPMMQGGVTRVPGTIYRGETRGNAKARLIPFEFAANDAVVLEFTANRMRVWRYGQLVNGSGASTPYELATPFGSDSLDRLQWVQSADVIWITDGLRPIQRLARYGLNDWTIAAVNFRTGPFRVQNLDKALRIQASGTTGNITLTATAPIFAANHAGSLLRLEPQNNSDIALWTGNTEIVNGDKMRYDGRVYQLIASANNSGVNPPQHREGIEMTSHNPVVRWLFVSDMVGVVRITSVTSSTVASATVIRTLPDTIQAEGTYRWSEGAWSARYGYPAALELHEQRLVAAATPSDPRTLWFSTVGDFGDFEPGSEADNSFAYSIAGGSSVNRVLWLKSGRDGLHIGALGEEHSSILPDRGQPLSATNIAFRFGSAYGSREHCRPIAPDGLPIFVSKDAARIIEISYSLEADANIAGVLSRPSDHLGAAGFAEIAWLGSPQRQAWLRTDAGDLAVMLYDPSEEVLGWAPVSVAGGFVESMAVTRDQSGSRDVLTMAVRRQVGGQTRRYVEEQAVTYGTMPGHHPIVEAIHLYAARVFQPAAPQATFQMPHMAGEAVHAWTDAGQFGPLNVPADGDLTLPAPVTRAVIGAMDDTHHIRSLPLIPPTNNGSSLHRRKRLSPPIGIGLHQSAAAKASVIESDFGQAERNWPAQNIVPRAVAADLTQAYSGVARAPLTSGYADELALKIEPVGGAPLTITAIVPTISEAGI